MGGGGGAAVEEDTAGAGYGWWAVGFFLAGWLAGCAIARAGRGGWCRGGGAIHVDASGAVAATASAARSASPREAVPPLPRAVAAVLCIASAAADWWSQAWGRARSSGPRARSGSLRFVPTPTQRGLGQRRTRVGLARWLALALAALCLCRSGAVTASAPRLTSPHLTGVRLARANLARRVRNAMVHSETIEGRCWQFLLLHFWQAISITSNNTSKSVQFKINSVKQ